MAVVGDQTYINIRFVIVCLCCDGEYPSAAELKISTDVSQSVHDDSFYVINNQLTNRSNIKQAALRREISFQKPAADAFLSSEAICTHHKQEPANVPALMSESVLAASGLDELFLGLLL